MSQNKSDVKGKVRAIISYLIFDFSKNVSP